jgi:hypothetical protein
MNAFLPVSWRSPIAFFPLLTLLSCSYSARTTKRLYDEALGRAPFDAIIVPGVPFSDGKWSRIMKGRVYWSKFLYDRGITKNVIYSGSAVYSPYEEGKIMAAYAIALGIPAEHVFSEVRAEHSTENVWYSYRLARNLGFRTIGVASDPFQTRMLRNFVKNKIAKEVALIPMVEDTMKAMETTMTDPKIDPAPALRAGFVSIKSRESLFKRLRGTMGKNIDSSAYSNGKKE